MKKPAYIFLGIMAVSMLSCKGESNSHKVEANNNVESTQAAPTKVAELAANAVPVQLTKADFLKLVMDYEKNPDTWLFQGEKPCIIDFYADWCAPCRITSPILEDLARDYAGRINIYKINIDKEQELASVFGVQSIPTFLFCPLTGNPTLSSGIANSPEATRKRFIQQIEELLLKKGNESTI
jgi:thioredoxin 1